MYKYFYDMYENTMKGTQGTSIMQPFDTIMNQASATGNYFIDVFSYMNDFSIPYFAASKYFNDVEREKVIKSPPIDSFLSYIELFDMNLNLATKSILSTLKSMSEYGSRELNDSLNAWFNTFFEKEDSETISTFLKEKQR